MSGGTRPVAVATVALLSLMLGVACGQQGDRAPSEEPLETFVGAVDRSAGSIALITDGDRLSGFVTDGKRNAKWFATADLDDGEAPLVARDGFELGEVTISGDMAEGEVMVGLATNSFEAEITSGDAGLFTAAEQSAGDSFEAGWIILQDGSERGTYDTFIDEEFTTKPAPKLRPTVSIPGFGAQAPQQVNSLFLDSNTQAP